VEIADQGIIFDAQGAVRHLPLSVDLPWVWK